VFVKRESWIFESNCNFEIRNILIFKILCDCALIICYYNGGDVNNN